MPDVALRSLGESWWVVLISGLIMALWYIWGQARWKELTTNVDGSSVFQDPPTYPESTAPSKVASSIHWNKDRLKAIPLVLLSTCALIGVIRAWQVMWIGDDAFITLRYSDMFARGEGPRF